MTSTSSIGSADVAGGGRTALFFAGNSGGKGTRTVSSGDKSTTVPVSVSESCLLLARQATSATLLIFLPVALIRIGASVFSFVKYRDARREFTICIAAAEAAEGPVGQPSSAVRASPNIRTTFES